MARNTNLTLTLNPNPYPNPNPNRALDTKRQDKLSMGLHHKLFINADSLSFLADCKRLGLNRVLHVLPTNFYNSITISNAWTTKFLKKLSSLCQVFISLR